MDSGPMFIHLYTQNGLDQFCMVKKRKSSNQLEKDRQDNRERMSTFAQKKIEERDAKESQARTQALEKLGITQEFKYKHHAEIYKYADHAVEAPIVTVDASIAPPKITIQQPCSALKMVHLSSLSIIRFISRWRNWYKVRGLIYIFIQILSLTPAVCGSRRLDTCSFRR